MGKDVASASFTREQRQQYREKVRADLDVFGRMLSQSSFEFDRQLTGMEIELNLVDDDYGPRMANEDVLAAIEDPEYQTELARYNIEFNLPPQPLPGTSALDLEAHLRNSLNAAERRSRGVGAHILMIGILPTVMPEHFEADWMSVNTRYQALNDAVLAARGEDIKLEIEGGTGERIDTYADSLAPESACTSVQLHLQVEPHHFAAHWNAAQVLAGPQLAMGANSPFFFGRQLWHETRIELFTQAADTRSVELKNQGVRPRVFFGERWITSIFDLFEENVRYFPALLPELTDEDPVAVLDAGGVPRLEELKLHNGTVYRWNRPIYDIVGGRPHLRVENRVLPAGPSIIDVMANSAFYYGALRMLASDDRPAWTRMSFTAAEENFFAGARDGIESRMFWPDRGEVPATELVLRHLLPLAHEGLRRWGVAPEVRDRYLSVIEGRALSGQNGASWQIEAVRRLEERGLDRPAALREMLRSYAAQMHENLPVHTWELP
ncbi:MAG: glutamate--cysteine ligase [Actinomycetota bacterium]|nr:glutamate--cysteine ligase [Actinomycetota bacterium]